MTDPRRSIPSMETLLGSSAFRPLIDSGGRSRVTEVLRSVQDEVRARLGAAGGVAESAATPDDLEDASWFADRVAERLELQDEPSLRRVINASGVVLHTNLGRAPLAEAAIRAIEGASGYTTLEYDLGAGTRGSRYDHCRALLRELTGAEDALVVNNNAAAVLVVLNTLALGGEAVVSRGELVEIGGSFRVPEILERSGARLREVGATNRTHPADYEAVLGLETALILKVHRSNFRVEGFTAEVGPAELRSLAEGAGVPLVHDLGSGALVDMRPWGLPYEPTAREALAHADLVTMSGDKLLGGPQAGLVLGRADLVDEIRRNPMARALRPDKLTLAALEATLRLYRDLDRAVREVPTLRMLSADAEWLAGRARDLVGRLEGAGVEAVPVPAVSAVGGGAYPGVELPTTAVRLGKGVEAEALVRALRQGEVPVIARIHEGRVLLDPRTIHPAEEAELVAAVSAAWKNVGRRVSGGAADGASAGAPDG